MGLLVSWLPWQPTKRDGVKVSKIWLGSMCDRAFSDLVRVPAIHGSDRHYLVRSARGTKKLLSRVDLEYHGNGPEYPDCDDYSVIAWGRALEKACHRGWKYGPAIGIIRLRFRGKEKDHMMNIVAFKGGDIALFEPQTGKYASDFSNIAAIYEIRF